MGRNKSQGRLRPCGQCTHFRRLHGTITDWGKCRRDPYGHLVHEDDNCHRKEEDETDTKEVPADV